MQAFQGRLHHGPAPGGMDGEQVCPQPGQAACCATYRVGDVVQLEVTEDVVAGVLELGDDLRPGSVEQLHAHLDEEFLLGELRDEAQGVPGGWKVKGDDRSAGVHAFSCVGGLCGWCLGEG